MRWLVALALTQVAAAGWRNDGTGGFSDGAALSAPMSWSVELPGPSNASPVRFADLICVSVEPTTTLCADAATGAVRWTAAHPVLDAAPDVDAALRARVAAADAGAPRLAELQASLGQEKRRARSRAPGAADAVAGIEAEVAQLTALLAETAPYRTDPLPVTIGWSSPTPVTDGEALFVSFANGVVASYTADGARRWIRWLGPRTGRLEFYDGVPTASPVLAGGHLLVAWDHLVALDPDTGADVWRGPAWVDYGSLTVADVDGLAVVLTPDGRALRATDGEVLASELGNHPWFNGPVYADGVAYWVGGRWHDEPPRGFRAEASARRLTRAGDGVAATPMWRVDIPSKDRFYAGPLVAGDRLYSADNTGHVFALARATGELIAHAAPDPKREAQIWAPLVALPEGVLVQYMDGALLLLGPDLGVLTTVTTGQGLASPWFEKGAAWVRTHGHLIRFGG